MHKKNIKYKNILPEIYRRILPDNSILSLWKIEEENQFFIEEIDFTSYDTLEFSKITHPEKQKQWLASRYLLKKISGVDFRLELDKTKNGKPYFKNLDLQFSVSHSGDIVGVIMGRGNFGLDIESMNPILTRISKKFIHPEDNFEENLENLTKIWTAKETIYKWLNISGFSLKENIKINKILENEIVCEYTAGNTKTSVIVHYFKKMDKIIAFISNFGMNIVSIR